MVLYVYIYMDLYIFIYIGIENDPLKELLELLEICLNLLFITIQNNSIKKTLISTPELTKQTETLLKTLLQLLLIPRLLKSQVDKILILLNLFFTDLKVRILGRNLTEIGTMQKKMSKGICLRIWIFVYLFVHVYF
jgi:hypothetical protein